MVRFIKCCVQRFQSGVLKREADVEHITSGEELINPQRQNFILAIDGANYGIVLYVHRIRRDDCHSCSVRDGIRQKLAAMIQPQLANMDYVADFDAYVILSQAGNAEKMHAIPLIWYAHFVHIVLLALCLQGFDFSCEGTREEWDVGLLVCRRGCFELDRFILILSRAGITTSVQPASSK